MTLLCNVSSDWSLVSSASLPSSFDSCPLNLNSFLIQAGTWKIKENSYDLYFVSFKNQNYHYLNKIWNVNCDSFQLSYSVGTFIHYKNMHSKLHFLDKSDNLRCPECRFPRPLMSIHPRPPYWRLCTGPGSPLEHWGCYHWTASWNWRVHLFHHSFSDSLRQQFI